MKLTHNGKSIFLLGDPHLGRTFVHGVPLHRRGDREKMVWRDFVKAMDTDCDIHICMGDLFDKWVVPYELILSVAMLYREKAEKNPKRQFFVLKGNHDWIRDFERRSAFDLFAAIVATVENIHVITDYTQVDDLLFCPWHPLLNAKEELRKFSNVAIAFGHWDTEFGDTNMVPTGCGVDKLYTGHVHKADEFVRDGTTVVVVGSMQPYAHGEESNDDLYITIPLGKLDDTETTNRCVRILLDQGEILDQEVECLQLTIKRIGDAQLDDAPTVTLGDFDMDALFRQAFAEVGVLPEITERVLGEYHSRRVQNGA